MTTIRYVPDIARVATVAWAMLGAQPAHGEASPATKPPASPHRVPDVVPDDLTAAKLLAEADKTPEGWRRKLGFATTAAYNNSRDVVGTVDGTTVQLGLILGGEASLKRGHHRWENELKLQETQTRTPQISTFVKSADTLDLKTTYLYRLRQADGLGPYLRGSLNTQVLGGYDMRADAVTVRRRKRDGAVVDLAKPSQTRIHLTDPFEPLVVRESGGVFAVPAMDEQAAINAKVGAGLQQIVARDGFAIEDKADTAEIELTQLRDANQAGAEMELQGKGVLSDVVTWEVQATFFYPLYSSVETELDGVELLNTDLSAKVSVKLNAWASLDYVFAAKRIPLVVDAWQVQNGIMLKAGLDLI